MKLTYIFLSSLAAGLVSVCAQQANLAAHSTYDPDFTRQNPQINLSGPAIKTEGYAGGVFAHTYTSGRQLRIVNPLSLNPAAPRSLGNGSDNLVFNPSTGRAEGVAILSFRF